MSNIKKTLSISPYSDPESLKASISGVNTTNGSFRSTAPELQFTGDRSIAILFTTPDHSIDEDNSYIFTDATYGDGRSLYIRGLSLFVGYGLNTVCLEKTVSTSTLYFVVISEHDQIVSAYLNGLDPIVIPPDTYTAPTGLKIGRGSTVSTRYQGVIHSCLLFNYALTPEEVELLWNDGEPLLDNNINLGSVGWYGIEWDITDPDPVCKRIGNMSLHRMLPIQSKMRGCLLNDDGEVVKYLNPDDWTNEVRDGSQGQVMVEIPQHYVRFESDGNIRRCKMSEQSLPGYTFIPTKYVSAYEATVQRSTSKLSSVVNTAEDYRGGDNNSAWDGTYRSLLGMPASNINRPYFRTYARNRKSGSTEWNCMDYNAYKAVFWLYYVEYANRNCQDEFNPSKDSNGYAQGGLGPGVTTVNDTKWGEYNNRMPFIPCGYTDEFGNETGIVEFDMPSQYDSAILTIQVPRYRGIENPFGHIWKWTDGINIQITPGDSGMSTVWVSDDPSKYNDSNYNGYSARGEEARESGYVSKLVFGELGDIMPEVVGGGPTSFWADYHYTNIPPSESLNGVLFGGYAGHGMPAGFVYACSHYAPAIQISHFGSRLCFIPGDNKEKKYYGCVAEYFPYNIINKVWVERSDSRLNLTGTGEFDFTYKVGDVDGYIRLSFPWGEEGGDNLYLFMKPPGYSQTCLVGSDENTLTISRQKSLIFRTNTPGLSDIPQSEAILDITQEEAVYTYVLESKSSVSNFTAAGGSSSLSSILHTYRNGNLVDSSSVVATYTGSASGFSISGTTITAENRGKVVGDKRSMEVTASYTTTKGAVVKDTLTITQDANVATYGDLVGGSATAADIPASGGTANVVTTNPTQTITYTSGATKAGSVTNSKDTSVSGSNLGTTAKARTKLGVIEVTFTGEGSKSKVISVDIYQAANVETLTEVYFNGVASSGTKDTIPYSGGTVTWAVTGVYSYTSGGTQNKAISASAGTWSVSGSGATQNSNITTWAQNLTEGSRSATITFKHTATGISGTDTTTQLSQNLVISQYNNIVSTYSNVKAGYINYKPDK